MIHINGANSMNKVLRKAMLTKTGVEYGDYVVNHIVGCSHGCLYPCYAYLMAHRFGKAQDMSEWMKPCLVENYLELLKKELPKLKNRIKSVQLCFSTDPFMFQRQEFIEASIKVIKLINSYNIPCYILTKGVLPKELSELDKINYYGITYVSNNEEFRKKFEPNAAPLIERLNSLKYLKEKGCKTWISIEPYPTPNIIGQNLMQILNDVSFADKIIFGRLHYNKQVSQYSDYQNFYNTCVNEVISFCKEKGIEYHIKNKTYIKSNKK